MGVCAGERNCTQMFAKSWKNITSLIAGHREIKPAQHSGYLLCCLKSQMQYFFCNYLADIFSAAFSLFLASWETINSMSPRNCKHHSHWLFTVGIQLIFPAFTRNSECHSSANIHSDSWVIWGQPCSPTPTDAQITLHQCCHSSHNRAPFLFFNVFWKLVTLHSLCIQV